MKFPFTFSSVLILVSQWAQSKDSCDAIRVYCFCWYISKIEIPTCFATWSPKPSFCMGKLNKVNLEVASSSQFLRGIGTNAQTVYRPMFISKCWGPCNFFDIPPRSIIFICALGSLGGAISWESVWDQIHLGSFWTLLLFRWDYIPLGSFWPLLLLRFSDVDFSKPFLCNFLLKLNFSFPSFTPPKKSPLSSCPSFSFHSFLSHCSYSCCCSLQSLLWAAIQSLLISE